MAEAAVTAAILSFLPKATATIHSTMSDQMLDMQALASEIDAKTVRLSILEDPLIFPCFASLAALGIYVLLRMCGEVLKALIIGRRSEAMKNQASAKKFEEEVEQEKEPPPEAIWVSGHGECYHVDESCRGLKAAVFVSQRRPCLVCAKKTCVTQQNVNGQRLCGGNIER